jgi:hypothetical protein
MLRECVNVETSQDNRESETRSGATSVFHDGLLWVDCRAIVGPAADPLGEQLGTCGVNIHITRIDAGTRGRVRRRFQARSRSTL